IYLPSHYSLHTRHTPIPTPFPYTTLFRSHDLRGQAKVPLREDRRGAHLHGPVSYLGRHHSLSTPAQDHVGRRHRILLRRALCPEIGRAQSELQSRFDLVCRLLLEKKKYYL